MTSRGHALSRDALIRTLTAYSGITSEDGAANGTTLVDTNLIGRNDFISGKTILILSGDAKDEDKGALSFDDTTGAITLRGTGVSAQIKAGTIFRVLNISSVEVDVANIGEDLGDMADAATSDDMSDILTTSALAKLRLILNRMSPDAFTATIQGVARTELDTMLAQLAQYFTAGGAALNVSIDGSARTTLGAIYAALGVLLGTRDATVSAGVLADNESALALLRRLATSGTLVHFGDITAVSAGVSSTIADLIGWEDDYFVGWWMTIVRDDGGAGATPQGEYRIVTSYTSTTGLCAHAAFSAADVVGDQALLIHPALYAAIAMRGGAETLESLDDELDAMMDMAKVPDTRTISVIGTEETITAVGVTGVVPFFVAGIWLGMENMAAGDVVRWRVFLDWDDASIADQFTDDEIWTFGGVQGQKWTYMKLNLWVTYEIAVKITQLDGTAKVFNCVLDTGQRGS